MIRIKFFKFDTSKCLAYENAFAYILQNYNNFACRAKNISPVGKLFANGLGDWGSTTGQVIMKTQKTVIDTSLLNIQHYKVWIKGKVEQSREMRSTLPYTSV